MTMNSARDHKCHVDSIRTTDIGPFSWSGRIPWFGMTFSSKKTGTSHSKSIVKHDLPAWITDSERCGSKDNILGTRSTSFSRFKTWPFENELRTITREPLFTRVLVFPWLVGLLPRPGLPALAPKNNSLRNCIIDNTFFLDRQLGKNTLCWHLSESVRT